MISPAAPPATPPAQQPGQQSSSTLQQQLLRIMEELRQGAVLEQTMFAMLTPDRRLLKARFVDGAAKDAPLRRFQINLQQRNLFGLLLARPQNLWLNDANRDKLTPLIPAPLQSMLCMEGFFCASLFANGRPFGVLYADCNSGAALDRQTFEQFKRLSQRLSNQLKSGTVRKVG